MEILEKFASLTLNAQAGIFVFLMLLASGKASSYSIPAPMATCWRYLIWTVPLFFNAAVVMDIYNTINDFISPEKLEPVQWNVTTNIVMGNQSVEVGGMVNSTVS